MYRLSINWFVEVASQFKSAKILEFQEMFVLLQLPDKRILLSID